MPCPDSLPAAAGAAAAVLAEGRSEEEVALLAALFTQLGDSLALLLASRAACRGTACGKSAPSENSLQKAACDSEHRGKRDDQNRMDVFQRKDRHDHENDSGSEK